jgi:hypothetical protein
MDEFGKGRADDSIENREGAEQRDLVQEHAMNAGEELRKRRSSRIVQAVPLTVSGVDALGRPFVERTSSLIINCHGCRYQSKHYVLKNMWVTLEIPHAESGQPPRQVRGRVAWIQRPRTVRQLFQVALELEIPGNVWGIGFPPEDWTGFGVPGNTRVPAIGHEITTPLPLHLTHAASEGPEETASPDFDAQLPPAAIGAETLHVMPAPASTTDASLQLARQVARLIADAKKQISAAAREAASQAVAQEHRTANEQFEQRFGSARAEFSGDADRAVERIQQESEARSRTVLDAAAKTLQDELPKWLKPHLESLTSEITAEIARSGAQQRQLQEEHLNTVSERVKQLCREAEEIARRIVAQSQDVERRIAEHASVTSAVLESQARKQEETFGAHHERLNATAGAAQQKLSDAADNLLGGTQTRLQEQVESARAQIQQLVDAAVARMNETATETKAQSASDLRNEIGNLLSGEIEQKVGALREAVNAISAGAEQRIKGLNEKLDEKMAGGLQEHAARLEECMGRSRESIAQLEHLSSRLDVTQQAALQGFQSQLDDVLSIHRNELHRRSETLFEDLNARIRRSFDEASRDAVNSFDERVRALAEPHIEQTNEAISRMAGGRSLLEASLTLQQDRIRGAADEAFAESLARFRENLGGVEQLLHEAAQGVIGRNLAELEGKAGDIQHRAGEEIYKTAEWYEKKTQTQLNHLTDKMVETGGHQLREKAGEVSAEFAAELDHSSRNFVGHTQNQMNETVRVSFDRARELFAEAADTTTAAFMDEIQRHARQELDGFSQVVSQTAAESNRQFAASREELAKHLTAEQQNFLHRFQERMTETLDSSVRATESKIQEGFAPLLDSVRDLSAKHREEVRASLAEMSSQATGDFKTRLDSVSNTWLLATVAKLDHQSRDVVSGLSASAHEKLREACADVFANVGESLRKRLQEITTEFSKNAAGSSK